MIKKVCFLIIFFILGAHSVHPESAPPYLAQLDKIGNLAPFEKTDRILVLAPHPDDETIGCAGIIQQAIEAGAGVQVVYLTNGDHNQAAFIVYEKRITLRKGEFIHMGQVRRKEAIEAMRLLGVNEKNLVFLGYPDFGTFAIFSQYWQEGKPFRSLLTRISSVPYKENPSFGAPYKGESILKDLERVLLAYRPNKIFVSHPADTNVDHKTLYLFLQVALSDLEKSMPKPKVYPYLVHCVGWPLPRHYHPELNLGPPENFLNSQVDWSQFTLTAEQLNKKYRAILCYKSQTQSSAFYLLSFARKNELFGDYPEVDLRKQQDTAAKAVSFFGFSNLFADSNVGEMGGLDNLIEIKGQASYALLDNSILIRINKTKKPDRRFSAIFYLFGYSAETPFVRLPKIRIIVRNNKFKVFDKKLMLKPQGISLESDSRGLILRVPLGVLGDPDFILASLKAYRGMLPVDVAGFRRINIK